MSEFRAAYRYALAVLQVAEEYKKLDEVSADFQSLENIMDRVKEFSLFLKSPVVSSEKKKVVLAEILRGKVGDITMKFVALLASRGREGMLQEIIRQFYRLRDERLGILNVKATTAVRFTDAQEKQLVSQLELATRKRIRISYIVDPSIKGGFTVQHEDTVWDASVRHQLELLRELFVDGSA